MARRVRPEIPLLDLSMPRLSGFEVCTRLKNNPKTRGMVIMILSARTDAESLRRVRDSGADDYLAKPMDPLDLISRIHHHLDP